MFFGFDSDKRWFSGAFTTGQICFFERVNANQIRISTTDFDVVERSEVGTDLRGELATGEPLRFGKLRITDTVAPICIIDKQIPLGMGEYLWFG